MGIHYRNASGHDIGVPDTPRNREIMEKAIAWLDARFADRPVTYLWPEDGLLYLGGPGWGEWDWIEGTHFHRTRKWTPDEPVRLRRQIRAKRRSDGEKMGVRYYRVWDPSLTREIDGLDVPASMGDRHLASAIDAAERFFGEHYRRDRPTERTVRVRAPGGKVTRWTVRAVTTVVFRAERKG